MVSVEVTPYFGRQWKIVPLNWCSVKMRNQYTTAYCSRNSQQPLEKPKSSMGTLVMKGWYRGLQILYTTILYKFISQWLSWLPKIPEELDTSAPHNSCMFCYRPMNGYKPCSAGALEGTCCKRMSDCIMIILPVLIAACLFQSSDSRVSETDTDRQLEVSSGRSYKALMTAAHDHISNLLFRDSHSDFPPTVQCPFLSGNILSWTAADIK